MAATPPARRRMVPAHDSTAFHGTQFELAYPVGIEAHHWQRARNAIVARELRGLAPAGAAALEVGCGRGIVVAHLRARGFDCHGVELAAIAVAGGLADFVRTGRDALALDRELRERFEVLLLLDVLEHLPDPGPFLEGLREGFPAARHLLVTVPARRELWSNYDEFYGHHRRYDPETLRAEAAAGGWRLARWRYAFRTLYAPMRVLARLGLPRAVALRAPRGRLARAAHRALGALSRLDYLLLPRSLRGASLVAILERPAAAAPGLDGPPPRGA